MGGLFGGLGIAFSGLQAQQQAQLTTAQNVANASTPGYTRETVVLSPVAAASSTPGQTGMGVQVDTIQRVRSVFLDAQYRTQNARLGAFQAQQQALSAVQSMTAEPNGNGLSSALDAFWAAWQGLASSPESMPSRQAVIAAGQTLASRFRQLYGQVGQERQSLDQQVRSDAQTVNRLATQIAGLNQQIQALSGGPQPPNALLDQRGQLLDQLSQYLPLQVTNQPDGTVDVAVGGIDLVAGNTAQTLDVTSNAANQGFAALTWSQTGAPLSLPASGGGLGALVALRDTTLPGYQSSLNTLAAAVANAVNGKQAAGYDFNGNAGGPFFDLTTGQEAGTIQVDAALTPTGVAAAATAAGAPGDGSNALGIADLANANLTGLPGETAGDYYGNLVAQIGSDGQTANQGVQYQQQLVDNVDNQRQSLSGVSLDQEMTNMVQYQQAYTAAAKVVTTIDSMLSTLVQMVQ